MKGLFFYEADCKGRIPKVRPTAHIKPLSPVKDHLCVGCLWHILQSRWDVGGGAGDFYSVESGLQKCF